jgi:hypothetical protein
MTFARAAAESGDDASARQAATGLYYATAATVLAAEGARLAAGGDARRLLLATLVLEHRIAPRDPLARPDAARERAFADLLLDESPVAPARAAALLA